MSEAITNPQAEVAPESIENRIEALLTKGKSEEPEETVETTETEEATETEESVEEKTEPKAEESDEEEVEYDGDVYVMPKKIKEALLRQSDYTQKTQVVAEQRKALEERAEMLSQRETMMAAGFELAVEIKGLEDRIKQYQSLDWATLVDNDPAQATKLNIAYQQEQEVLRNKRGTLQQKEQEINGLIRVHRQKTVSSASEAFRKEVKDFTPELDHAMMAQAVDLGYTPKQLEELSLPMIRAIYKSLKWDKLQASKSTVTKKVADVRSVPNTARAASAKQADSKVKEARQALAKSGSKDAAENYFERLLSRR